ncbi:MAG: gluconokinase [Corynebacterium sp.]|uniref:gluconokinase n=1 Tax=Corynebacterium sp. TaxID=1720 RepID=UPI0026DF2D85|nr:gluconokinase [Corynebacterium sp.]MDO5669039.1 gluconokinase [Corynebacterium sp.]
MTGPHIIVMGTSGTGKSTVGKLLADALDLPWLDGDDLHPPPNIAKMTVGEPLTDEDRRPWLQAVGRWLAQRPAGGVIACSALKRPYRDLLRTAVPGVRFVHLQGEQAVLAERMGKRRGHFMPASLLDSQLAVLEPLGADEAGCEFDVAHSPSVLVAQIGNWLDA